MRNASHLFQPHTSWFLQSNDMYYIDKCLLDIAQKENIIGVLHRPPHNHWVRVHLVDKKNKIKYNQHTTTFSTDYRKAKLFWSRSRTFMVFFVFEIFFLLLWKNFLFFLDVIRLFYTYSHSPCILTRLIFQSLRHPLHHLNNSNIPTFYINFALSLSLLFFFLLFFPLFFHRFFIISTIASI